MDNTTDSMEQRGRALFEAHMRKEGWGGWSLERSPTNDLYNDGTIERMWRVWQAAFAAQPAVPSAPTNEQITEIAAKYAGQIPSGSHSVTAALIRLGIKEALSAAQRAAPQDAQEAGLQALVDEAQAMNLYGDLK